MYAFLLIGFYVVVDLITTTIIRSIAESVKKTLLTIKHPPIRQIIDIIRIMIRK